MTWNIQVAPAPTNGVPVGYGGAAPAAVRTSVEPTLPLDMQTPNKTLFVQVVASAAYVSDLNAVSESSRRNGRDDYL